MYLAKRYLVTGFRLRQASIAPPLSVATLRLSRRWTSLNNAAGPAAERASVASPSTDETDDFVFVVDDDSEFALTEPKERSRTPKGSSHVTVERVLSPRSLGHDRGFHRYSEVDDACQDDDNEYDENAVAEQSVPPTAAVSSTVESGSLPTDMTVELSPYVLRHQELLRTCSTEELVTAATSYLRATENLQLVSAEEEHAIFPVLLSRLPELHISQLLSVVECHWARSTLVRYGTTFQDSVRDRIAQVVNHAAHYQSTRQATPRSGGTEADDTSGEGQQEADHIFAFEKDDYDKLKSKDPVLASAASELDADTVLRCIVVMGLSAGHRKRDLEFFSAMGAFFAANINKYKDPHDFVHVLTAFARAKVIPSQSFLSLLSRRFPVVSKKVVLEPLPCYRAMVNFAKMGHSSVNTFRFFADYMLGYMEERLAAERLAEKQAPGLNTSALSSSNSLAPNFVREKARLFAVTGLKPSMLSRWLLVLARCGAPHQQYLRPLIVPIVVPMLPLFPPPSLTRLLVALRHFSSGDPELLEPVIDHLCKLDRKEAVCGAVNVSSGASAVDVLMVLAVLSSPDTPVPSNFSSFITLCERMFGNGVAEAAAVSEGVPVKESGEGVTGSSGRLPSVAVVLRPTDMCFIAKRVLLLQRRPEISLESLAPLTALIEAFADRLTVLLELHVVSLTHVDIFADLCAEMQHPDASGHIAKMVAARKSVSSMESEDTGGALLLGEDAYYSALDIDVRDTFFKILVINGSNTYGAYRPLPGPMQLDFREWLTKMSAFDVLQAVDLYERACPGALRTAPRRFLSRSIIQKLGTDGEEVVNEEKHVLELRQPREQTLTREDLIKFVDLLQRTPLKRARRSPIVWRYVKNTAEKLQLTDAALQAAAYLQEVEEA